MMLNETKADYAVILRDAAALIDQGFTQGSHAKDNEGRVVPVDSPTACCWCAIGAISAAASRHSPDYDVRSRVSDVLISAVALSEDLPQKVYPGARRSMRIVLMTWNDAFDRKASEVSGAMRKVADDVEKGVV